MWFNLLHRYSYTQTPAVNWCSLLLKDSQQVEVIFYKILFTDLALPHRVHWLTYFLSLISYNFTSLFAKWWKNFLFSLNFNVAAREMYVLNIQTPCIHHTHIIIYDYSYIVTFYISLTGRGGFGGPGGGFVGGDGASNQYLPPRNTYRK